MNLIIIIIIIIIKSIDQASVSLAQKSQFHSVFFFNFFSISFFIFFLSFFLAVGLFGSSLLCAGFL